jgi:hypothetical protein
MTDEYFECHGCDKIISKSEASVFALCADCEAIRKGSSMKDTDTFIVRGFHLRLIADELRRLDILKTPHSHEALHTIGKVLQEILDRPLCADSDHKTP